MRRLPSEHFYEIVSNPSEEIFNVRCNEWVEQSAIYSNIYFRCLNMRWPGIVLTSQCDIEDAERGTFVLLALITSVEFLFHIYLDLSGYTDKEITGIEPIASGKKKRKEILNNFKSSYLEGKAKGYYYLPLPIEGLEHSCIHFDTTQCLSLGRLESQKKECVLRSPFREAIPAKFAAYIGRIGTARFEDDYFSDIMDGIYKMQS